MLALADDAALARLVIAAAQRRSPLPASKLSESRGRGHARAASTTRLHELAIEIDRGDGMAGGERDDLMPARRKERIAVHDERATPVETAYFLMQSFKNALLSEPLSFCSFACIRQAIDFAALCSSCWVGLMLCATRSDFDVASDELSALAGSPASPRTITMILADTKRRRMSVPPCRDQYFATTISNL